MEIERSLHRDQALMGRVHSLAEQALQAQEDDILLAKCEEQYSTFE